MLHFKEIQSQEEIAKNRIDKFLKNLLISVNI